MLDSKGGSFTTPATVNKNFPFDNSISRFLPIAEFLPKYFFEIFSEIKTALEFENGFIVLPSFNSKSKTEKKLLSTRATSSLNVLFSNLTAVFPLDTRQEASTSGKPACKTGTNGTGVTVFRKICPS